MTHPSSDAPWSRIWEKACRNENLVSKMSNVVVCHRIVTIFFKRVTEDTSLLYLPILISALPTIPPTTSWSNQYTSASDLACHGSPSSRLWSGPEKIIKEMTCTRRWSPIPNDRTEIQTPFLRVWQHHGAQQNHLHLARQPFAVVDPKLQGLASALIIDNVISLHRRHNPLRDRLPNKPMWNPTPTNNCIASPVVMCKVRHDTCPQLSARQTPHHPVRSLGSTRCTFLSSTLPRYTLRVSPQLVHLDTNAATTLLNLTGQWRKFLASPLCERKWFSKSDKQHSRLQSGRGE